MTARLTGALLLAGVAALAQGKRSVAVEDFDFSTVRSESAAIFGTQVDLGKGMSALMVRRIAQGGKFTVVERNKVATVLKEQDFGASGRVKRGTQARIGQVRGADYTIMGDVVVFGRDDRRRRVGAGAYIPGSGGGLGGVSSSEFKAVVVLNFRMVDNESSEIVMTGAARGESKRSSRGGLAAIFTGGVGAGGVVDFGSSNFGQTIIGEAVIDACDKLAAQVNQQATGVSSTRQIDIEGRVAAVDGATVYINIGSSAGVQVGDTFEISRVVREVKDPVTKEVLDVVTAPVGSLKITMVREKVAIGAFAGGQTPVEGDKVEKK